MLENNLIYQDDYMYFTFNGIYSKDYNLMIQNNIDDLKIITNDGASIDYVSPKYQNGRYMMGVTRSHRSIPHKLVANGITRREANQIATWLATGEYGPLVYDYASDWQYNVVVSKLGDINLYPIDTKRFIVSFDITFETIEGTDAENVQDAVIMLDDLQLYTDAQGSSDQAYYGLNNSKLIPAIACYNKLSSSSTKKDCIQFLPKITTVTIADQSETTFEGITNCTIPLYIHHLGSGYSLLNLSALVGSGDASLSISSYNIDNSASINYERNEASGFTQPTIIDYKSHNHLFFINNEMPESKELYKEIENLKTIYSNNSIAFKSPGGIQIVLERGEALQEKIETLIATPYHWFFYCTNDVTSDATPYYRLYSINEFNFPRTASGVFLYDLEYTSETNPSITITDYWNEEYTVKDYSVNVEQLLEKMGSYKTIYFGYYDKVTINANPLQNITLSVTQYNNLLIGE